MSSRNLFSFLFLIVILTLAVVVKAANFPLNKSSEKEVARHNATAEEKQVSEDQPVVGDTVDEPPAADPAMQIKDKLRNYKANQLNRDEALVKAARKRRVATLLRNASERSKEEGTKAEAPADNERTEGTPEETSELTNEAFQEVANLRRAKVLESEADLLDGKAKAYESRMKDTKLDAIGFPVCDMVKIGPLEFVPAEDEIRHRIDHTVMGQLDGKTLTIMRAKRPRLTYELRSIQLPIFNVADSGENCLGFTYHEVDQVLCTVNEIARNSWMDALSEAWFCHNEGLQGTLPSIKATEEVMATKKEAEKPTPPPKEEKPEPQALVDINLGVDAQGNPKLTVNGKEVPKSI